MLTHPDRRVQPARGDDRQKFPALLVAAVRQQRRSELTIGEPVRGDRRAVGQQFLGHHVAVQMTQPAAAVLGGDGQADEPRVAQPGGEFGVPPGQPGVDGGLPAELVAIGGEKLPDGRP